METHKTQEYNSDDEWEECDYYTDDEEEPIVEDITPDTVLVPCKYDLPTEEEIVCREYDRLGIGGDMSRRLVEQELKRRRFKREHPEEWKRQQEMKFKELLKENEERTKQRRGKKRGRNNDYDDDDNSNFYGGHLF